MPLSVLLESVNESFCTLLVIFDCVSVAFLAELVNQLSKVSRCCRGLVRRRVVR